MLSENTNEDAIEILKENPDKIHWKNLSQNPAIFVDTYRPACKAYFQKYVIEEMMQVVWHPQNFKNFAFY